MNKGKQFLKTFKIRFRASILMKSVYTQSTLFFKVRIASGRQITLNYFQPKGTFRMFQNGKWSRHKEEEKKGK